MRTPTPTAEEIAGLLASLRRLYAPGGSPVVGAGGGVNQEVGESFLPCARYAQFVREFAEAASKECGSDGEHPRCEVNGILAQAVELARFGTGEFESGLTSGAIGERLGEGRLGERIEVGDLRRVIERLAELGSERTESRAAKQKRLMQQLPWSEDLQQQTRVALEELSTPPDGLLHVKHKALGYAAINMLEFLQNGLLVCASSDGRRWEYPDVETLLTAGWAID